MPERAFGNVSAIANPTERALGNVSAIASPTEAPPAEIVWLHIPKCGTSFLNTLYHYACPGIPPSAGVGTEIDPMFLDKDLTVKYPMDRSWDELCTKRLE